ncbi:MAG: 30S ribosomal protein S10 [Candidatus Micrarchaeia archaeon]
MKAIIKLVSTSSKSVEDISHQIKSIADSINVKYRGPIPLPVHRISETVRKAPNGDGSKTFEKWELRIYKRLIEIDGNDQAFRQIMRIPVPDNVQIEISLVE